MDYEAAFSRTGRRGGTFFAAAKQIATRTGQTERTFWNHLKALRAAGLIDVVTTGNGVLRKANEYRIKWTAELRRQVGRRAPVIRL